MKLRFWFVVLALAAPPAWAGQPLKVMTYNILHGQPCSGGSLGSEVGPRMDLAVSGPPNTICDLSHLGATCGLAALAPDVLGMQEVSQVFVNQSTQMNQTCAVFAATGQLDSRVGDTIFAFEHAADRLVRRMNAATLGGPYKMRFVRDNPRVLPLVPDIPLPPDDKSLSDIAAETGNVEIGLAVISKYRIQLVTVHNLTIGAVPGETRAILHATIQVPDQSDPDDPAKERSYDFYDTHVTTTGGDSPQTIAMVAEIIRFIATSRRHPENPGFLTCDCNLNEGPLDAFPPAIEFGVPPEIEGPRAYQLFKIAGFVDSFRKKHPDVAVDPGQTSGRNGLSTVCNQPLVDGRIDYVWAIPNQEGKTPKVTDSQVVMDYSESVADGGCRFPSDHDGVRSTFDLGDLEPAS